MTGDPQVPRACWDCGVVHVAAGDAAEEHLGFLFGGLGAVWVAGAGLWAVVSANTGGFVASLDCGVTRMMEVVEGIAALADWADMLTPDSWRNRDPGLPDRLVAYLGTCGCLGALPSGGPLPMDLAQAIAEKRGVE